MLIEFIDWQVWRSWRHKRWQISYHHMPLVSCGASGSSWRTAPKEWKWLSVVSCERSAPRPWSSGRAGSWTEMVCLAIHGIGAGYLAHGKGAKRLALLGDWECSWGSWIGFIHWPFFRGGWDGLGVRGALASLDKSVIFADPSVSYQQETWVGFDKRGPCFRQARLFDLHRWTQATLHLGSSAPCADATGHHWNQGGPCAREVEMFELRSIFMARI